MGTHTQARPVQRVGLAFTRSKGRSGSLAASSWQGLHLASTQLICINMPGQTIRSRVYVWLSMPNGRDSSPSWTDQLQQRAQEGRQKHGQKVSSMCQNVGVLHQDAQPSQGVDSQVLLLLRKAAKDSPAEARS